MLRRLFSLFGKKNSASPAISEEEYQAWDEKKSGFFETVLGSEHDMVMHALIPYAIGGGLDLYYFPNHPEYSGTAIATKELVELPGQGPSNRDYAAYELVMFTKHALDLDAAKDDSHPFGQAHSQLNRLLNAIARYAAQATLNPNETCEFPADFEHLGGKCLLFDGFTEPAASKESGVGLMLVLEVHRPEMDYAREQGGAALIEKLKSAGHYPYSDLDREPVV
ncbi:MAG: suppressor of fused domain protein [Planctomycetota bacterium]